MKHHIKRISTHPLVIGSSIMVIGSLLGNVSNFLFNIYMVRSLSIADYGILASINSLITLPSLAAGAIIPTVISFAGTYFAKNNLEQASGLFFKISKYFVVLGGIILLLFIIFSRFLAEFLQIPNTAFIVLAGVIVFFGFMGAVNMAFLQAKLAFKFIVSINIIGAISKLLLGILLVSLGYSVGGAIWAFLLSFMLPYLFTFIPLKELFNKHLVHIHTPSKELFVYGLPAALCVFSLTSFVTSDILLVKHFFTPEQAGIYASFSLIAKIIFFISGPITSVMFPLVVQRHNRQEKYNHLFLASLFFVAFPSLIITALYFLFPELILQLFFKTGYTVQNAWLLGYFGIFITIYSIVSLVSNYFLSIKKTYIAFPLIIAALGQILVIWMFHADFFQVIWYSTLVLSLLLLMLLLYYCKIHYVYKNETS